MNRILLVSLTCLAAAWIARADNQESFTPLKSTLKFREDHTFKIVAFGDVHWNGFADKDKQTLKAMDTILEEEKPDFVIYTGDNSLSDHLDKVREGYLQMTEPVVRRGIPWASTLGNHDAEWGGISRKAAHACTVGLPGSLSRMGPEEIHGYSNFILPVMDKDGQRPAALLYVLDSNAYFKDGVYDCYDWIREDQVQWYRKASAFYKAANQGQPVPSYAFFHIPLPEFNLAFHKGTVVGVKQESVCDSEINGGMWAAMLEERDLKGVFCGHDHVNDFIAGYNGVWLGYVRGISYHTYGKEGFAKGSRVIQLKEGAAAFDTWLRLEDKQAIQRLHCE
jgi:hypothetical protein